MTTEVQEETITVRELQRNAAEVLDRARRGQVFVVTRRGVKVAHILPPDPVQGAVEQAIVDGVLDPKALENLPATAEIRGMTRGRSRSEERSWSEAIIATREEEGDL